VISADWCGGVGGGGDRGGVIVAGIEVEREEMSEEIDVEDLRMSGRRLSISCLISSDLGGGGGGIWACRPGGKFLPEIGDPGITWFVFALWLA